MFNKSLIKKNQFKNTFIRKTLCATLILSLSISMTGCGGSSDSGSNKPTGTPGSTQDSSDSENAIGDFYPSTAPKEFSNEYLKITLTDDYEENETTDYIFNYSSPYSLCFGMSEGKDSVAAAGYTVSGIDDYAVVAMQSAGISAEVEAYNDTTRSFSWEKDINGTLYCYKAYVTETESSYWMFQFAAQKDVFTKLSGEYNKYYDSIVFNN